MTEIMQGARKSLSRGLKLLSQERGTLKFLLIGSALTLAVATGFVLGQARSGIASALLRREPRAAEPYFAETSFSELVNAKEKLEALAGQFVTDLRLRHHGSPTRVAELDGIHIRQARMYSFEPLKALDELESELERVKGSGAERILNNELLWLLKREHLLDRWLTVYLEILYEHPTDDLVLKNAAAAVSIAYARGRQHELSHAGDFLRRVSISYPEKEQIIRVFAAAEPPGESLESETELTPLKSDCPTLAP